MWTKVSFFFSSYLSFLCPLVREDSSTTFLFLAPSRWASFVSFDLLGVTDGDQIFFMFFVSKGSRSIKQKQFDV